jgi:predicted GNAT family acetyltransferase
MGSFQVEAATDAATAIARAGRLLSARPIELNVIWSVMKRQADSGGVGRYWLLTTDGEVAGIVIESPPGQSAGISPMPRDHSDALARAIAGAGYRLSGISGEAPTASAFAGCWTEQVKVAAIVSDAQRLYALGQLVQSDGVPGRLRRAELYERDMVVEWVSAFQAETGAPGGEVAPAVDSALSAGRLFLWDDDGPRCLARATEALGGISRIGIVFTAPRWRRRGYATACVGALCEWVRTEQGANSVLYAQLGNASSNSVYRSLGFEGVSEVLMYRFEDAGARS